MSNTLNHKESSGECETFSEKRKGTWHTELHKMEVAACF